MSEEIILIVDEPEINVLVKWLSWVIVMVIMTIFLLFIIDYPGKKIENFNMQRNNTHSNSESHKNSCVLF